MEVYGNTFRQKRFARFLGTVDRTAVSGRAVRVLDLGGRTDYWETLKPLWQDRRLDITIVNMDDPEMGTSAGYRLINGNACNLPQLADNSFDVVHSNSVIEHVGKWANMAAMAREARRLAPHHFIQTPNFWFPLEPHFRTLFIHWYPQPLQAALLMRKTRGFHSVRDYDDAMLRVQGIRLLTRSEMQHLFPDSEIQRERVGPLVKSLIAVR